jgi:hypothetical protein
MRFVPTAIAVEVRDDAGPPRTAAVPNATARLIHQDEAAPIGRDPLALANPAGRPISALPLANGHADLLEACIGRPIFHPRVTDTPNSDRSSKRNCDQWSPDGCATYMRVEQGL